MKCKGPSTPDRLRDHGDWRSEDPPATRLVLIEHGERQRPGTPITIVNLMRSPNPMQAACVVSTPMPILIFVTAFFLGKRGLVPRGTFLDKKNNQKDFFDRIFLPGRVAVPYRIGPGPWRAAGTWLGSASGLNLGPHFLCDGGSTK